MAGEASDARQADADEQIQIGVDEWVAQVDRRRRARTGPWGAVANTWESTPVAVRLGLVAILLLIAPVVTATEPVLDLLGISNNDFIVRTGTTFLAFSILAVGLNVVVGYAGLLDLGYVAFFGLSGYAYAYLSSDFIQVQESVTGVHIPTIVSIPLIVAFTALVGWLLGSVSIRLVGDYLAIVTLGFGQLFVQLTTTLTRVRLFWLPPGQTVDLTRGPNGINLLDEVVLFGYHFESTLQYYYLFFALLAVVLIVVHRVNESRVGRAWRAMGENELAAEVMGMPTRRLKLLAFAIGAGIAALTGTVHAAWQGNVVPSRYNVLMLINLYAMVVLGGTGSLPGVVLGAFIFTTLPELLRNVQLAGFLFYGGGLIGLIVGLRPFRRLATVLGATVAGGFILKLLVNAVWPGLDAGVTPSTGSFLNRWVQSWLIIPGDFKLLGNVVLAAAVLLLLVTMLAKQPWRWVLLAATLYLGAFAWETRLATEPSVTRVLVIGITLVVLMIYRPQGLLGKTQVQLI